MGFLRGNVHQRILIQMANAGNSNTRCPFCEENFPSLKELHDHLIQCGTKTDQCPKCERFIQRAIFAYHYENNCALVDQLNQFNSDRHSRSNQCIDISSSFQFHSLPFFSQR